MSDSESPPTKMTYLLESERWWLIAFFFFIPLKLSFAYGGLFPALALWYGKQAFRQFRNSNYPQIAYPLYYFIALATASCFFAFAPLHSLVQTGKEFFLIAVIPLVYQETKRDSLPLFLAALLAGQTIAALATVLEMNFPLLSSRFFNGAVTESGQLALTLPLALGALFFVRDRMTVYTPYVFGVIVSLLLGSGFLFPSRPLHIFSVCLGFAALGYFAFIAYTHAKHNRNFSAHFTLSTIVVPLLTVALLYNLKRGPWLGVSCALVVFLFLHARKILIPTIGVILLTVLFSEPIQQRILASLDHFFIPGGRSEIWSIGWDLALRFPLGIGFDNSSVLNSFSTTVPQELKHFHSNPLNILVETGWAGIALYLYWVYRCLVAGFGQKQKDPRLLSLTTALACGFLSWQISGLVEYNFGDSEVLLLALSTVGLLGALVDNKKKLS